MAGGEVCGERTRKGSPCQHRPGWGTNHPGTGKCKRHEDSDDGLVLLARRESQVMGEPLLIAPQDAILECIRIAAGEVAYASERISELEAGEAVGPVLSRALRRSAAAPADAAVRDAEVGEEAEASEPRVEDIRYGPPALHIWITVRRQALDRLAQYSFAALKWGIEERRVRNAEQRGVLVLPSEENDDLDDLAARRAARLAKGAAGT